MEHCNPTIFHKGLIKDSDSETISRRYSPSYKQRYISGMKQCSPLPDSLRNGAVWARDSSPVLQRTSSLTTLTWTTQNLHRHYGPLSLYYNVRKPTTLSVSQTVWPNISVSLLRKYYGPLSILSGDSVYYKSYLQTIVEKSLGILMRIKGTVGAALHLELFVFVPNDTRVLSL